MQIISAVQRLPRRFSLNLSYLCFPRRLRGSLGSDDLVLGQRLPGQQRELLQQPERGALGAPRLAVQKPPSRGSGLRAGRHHRCSIAITTVEKVSIIRSHKVSERMRQRNVICGTINPKVMNSTKNFKHESQNYTGAVNLVDV